MKSKYMKRIMLLATAVLTMSSCDSFLDTSPEDLRSPEQIYETYSSTQNAMFGVYSYIRGTYPFDMPDTYSTSDVDVAYTNTHTFDMGVWSASSASSSCTLCPRPVLRCPASGISGKTSCYWPWCRPSYPT